MVNNSETKVIYKGDGETKVFPYTFAAIDADTIKVAVYDETSGVESTLTNDYYVDTTAKTVTYPGYAPGQEPAESQRPGVLQETQKLVVYRETPLDQQQDLGEKYPLPIVESIGDKLTLIVQELAEKLGRCVMSSISGSTTFEEWISTIKQWMESSKSAAQTAKSWADAAEISEKGASENAKAAAESEADALAALASAKEYARTVQETAAGIKEQAVPAWDSKTAYSYPSVVCYTDGFTYRCLGENVPAGTVPAYSTSWVRITAVNGDDYFELDEEGALMPRLEPTYSVSFSLDADGDIVPYGVEDDIVPVARTAAEAAANAASASAAEAKTSEEAAAASASAAKESAAAASASAASSEKSAQEASAIEFDDDGDAELREAT